MTTILSPLGAPAQSFAEVRAEFGADWAAALAHDTKTVIVAVNRLRLSRMMGAGA